MSDGELHARSDPYGDGYRICPRNAIRMARDRMDVYQGGHNSLTGLLANVGLRLVLRLHRSSSLDTLHLLSTPVTHRARSFGTGIPFLDAFSILVVSNQAALSTDALSLGICRRIRCVMGGPLLGQGQWRTEGLRLSELVAGAQCLMGGVEQEDILIRWPLRRRQRHARGSMK